MSHLNFSMFAFSTNLTYLVTLFDFPKLTIFCPLEMYTQLASLAILNETFGIILKHCVNNRRSFFSKPTNNRVGVNQSWTKICHLPSHRTSINSSISPTNFFFTSKFGEKYRIIVDVFVGFTQKKMDFPNQNSRMINCNWPRFSLFRSLSFFASGYC